jgi:hypothetical protein
MMKKTTVCVLLALALVLPLAAQSGGVNSMGFSGTTGLYVVPTAHLGWEESDVGFNAGVHTNYDDRVEKFNTLLQFNISLFKWVELAAAYDIQPEFSGIKDNDDFLFGIKVKLPVTATNIALGANIDYGEIGSRGDHFGNQFYGVVTYDAEFFSMPAETTLFVGKTFIDGARSDSNIDFGMGFDLIILPKYLQSFVHWLIDFSNFGYSIPAHSLQSNSGWGLDPSRGILNTGLRIDLSQIPALNKFTFAFDAYLTDAFDDKTRGFGLGVVFGASL